LKRRFSRPDNVGSSGRQILLTGFVAVAFTVLGGMIASDFDAVPNVNAQTSVQPVSQLTPYPIVKQDGEYESPFVRIVEQTKDAVVNVAARVKNRQTPWWHRGPNYSLSSGSGFFFRKDGYVLTNAHVVNQADELTVTTSAGYEFDAWLVGTDPKTDLAVLKVDLDEDVVTIPFGNSDEIKVGSWAIAIGNPFPQQGLDRTVTVGVISAKGRNNLNFGSETPEYQDYIQTDASINPGNSGGPLLNLKGECVGVNAAISSPTGTSVGIGFAIPINMARSIIPDLIETGHVSRGWLGIQMHDLSRTEARDLGLKAVSGVVINQVLDNSPAQEAGIKSGDILVGFNNQPVKDIAQLQVLVSTVSKGSGVPIEVLRDGNKLTLTASVGDRDEFEAMARAKGEQEPSDFAIVEWMGMEVMEFSKDIAGVIGADFVSGMFVRKVYPGSPADRASVARGTVLLQVADKPVKTLTSFEKIVSNIQNRKMRIPLIVQEPDGTIARKVIRQN